MTSNSPNRAECYMLQTNDYLWKKNRKDVGWCHGGTIYPTLNPNEMKCNYCGWTKIEMNLGIS